MQYCLTRTICACLVKLYGVPVLLDFFKQRKNLSRRFLDVHIVGEIQWLFVHHAGKGVHQPSFTLYLEFIGQCFGVFTWPYAAI